MSADTREKLLAWIDERTAKAEHWTGPTALLVLSALRGECERHGLEPEWRDAEDIRKGCKRRCLCTDTYPCADLRRLASALLGENNP